MSVKICAAILLISVVAVSASEPSWWLPGAQWWGAIKLWRPTPTPIPIWEPLVLGEGTSLGTVPSSGSSAGVTAGTTAVAWNTVTCPAGDNPTESVGDCAWTGVYLVTVQDFGSAGKDVAALKVNWNILCQITKPCGRYGVGTISVIGRAGGVDDTSPVDMTIIGGTGAYAGFNKGGVMSVGGGKFTFRFVR